MIRLFQFEPALGLPNASPFCMKLETYLRMAGLTYELPAPKLQHLLRAPKAKLPYILDQGKTVADSSFIIAYLKATYGDPLDAWLNAPQRATALAFQRLCEENLYWAVVYTRWVEAPGWAMTRDVFFGKLPLPLRWLLPSLARRGIARQLQGQGMGRHTRDEIMAIGQRDITALADFLGDKPYIMGDQPCSLDATVYAFLANLLVPPLETALKRHAQQRPTLLAYCERMRLRYYA